MERLLLKLPVPITRNIHRYLYYSQEQHYENFINFYFKNRVVLQNIKSLYELYNESFIIDRRMKTLERLRDHTTFYRYILIDEK